MQYILISKEQLGILLESNNDVKIYQELINQVRKNYKCTINQCDNMSKELMNLMKSNGLKGTYVNGTYNIYGYEEGHHWIMSGDSEYILDPSADQFDSSKYVINWFNDPEGELYTITDDIESW